MTRRTQAERSTAATAALIAAARRMFGRDGYGPTSIEAVAAGAGMTKGAAYHHFAGKVDLFRAVFIEQERDLAASLARASAEAADSWTALLTGCQAFLERCLDHEVRQIVLLDGPAVLGWAEVRQIEYDHTLRLLQRGMRAAAQDGWIAAGDVAIRSHLIFGALCEAGMLLARSDEPAATLETVSTEAQLLLNALAEEPGHAGPRRSGRTGRPARRR